MPKRLPVKDIVTGLVKTILKAIRFWLHSTLVAISWLAIVPLTACRIYRCLFAGSVSSLLTLPLDILSTENVAVDIIQGCFVVLCSLGAFISLVWLREQILSGGGPEWLNGMPIFENNNNNNNPAPPQPVAAQPPRANQQQILFRFRNAANNLNEQPVVENNINNHDDNNNNNNNNNNINNEAAPHAIPPAGPPRPVPAAAAAQDDNHWNPMEWDRAAEDLTWDRLLGLDGSLLFLEHVFWVISLNTLFILVFAFCPYHLGHYMIYGFKMHGFIERTHFEGLITTIVGYIALAVALIFVYAGLAFST